MLPAELAKSRRARLDCQVTWARSHAGRASFNLAAPADVRLTSFSGRSSLESMANQPEELNRHRLRVSFQKLLAEAKTDPERLS